MSDMQCLTSLDAVILSNSPGSDVDAAEVELNAMWIHSYYRLGRLGRWWVMAKMRFAVWTAARLRRRIKALESRLARLKRQEEMVYRYENQIGDREKLPIIIKNRLGIG